MSTLPVTQTNVQETQIAPYAPPRAEVRELVERFKAGLTNSKDLSDNELRALATAALGHSLNPWNQEIWAIPGKGLMLGIKGLRKVADRQAEKGGFRWWTEFLDIRSAAEMEQYDVPETAVAAKLCVLRRSDNIEAYLHNLKDLQGSGLPYEAAAQLIGGPPKTIGVGYVLPNEKSEMPIPQRVMKRAEAHAIKQAFSVPFRNEYNVDLEPIEPMGGFSEDWEPAAQIVNGEAELVTAEISEPAPAPETLPADEPQQSAPRTFPFPPSKKFTDFGKGDWAAFWPFVAEQAQVAPSDARKYVHMLMGVETMKDCGRTFGEFVDALASDMDARQQAAAEAA